MRYPLLKGLFFLWIFCALPVWAQDRVSGSLIAETQSGYLFFKDNVKAQMAPASLTKLMTLYLTFSALEKGWLKWEDKLPVSEHAALQPRTNLGLYAGQTLTVRQAVEATIIHSANDAAVVLAEALARDEKAFAKMMTQTARQLKMNHTNFKNASGLHEEGQETTPHDMAILALALIHHYPQYYSLFSQKEFDFNGHTYTSHNKLLNDYQGVEGMKTGYVAAVGYNMISTAQKDGTRLVGIVMGAKNKQDRDQRMKNLLDKGFQKVAIQKRAVSSGELAPAMDPLHRHLMLRKVDLAPFATEMQIYSKKAVQLARVTTPPVFNTIAPNSLQRWTIQVGAFKSMAQAVHIAQSALSTLKAPDIKIATQTQASLHKAQLTGFSDKGRAEQACHFLNQKDFPCFLVSKS